MKTIFSFFIFANLLFANIPSTTTKHLTLESLNNISYHSFTKSTNGLLTNTTREKGSHKENIVATTINTNGVVTLNGKDISSELIKGKILSSQSPQKELAKAKEQINKSLQAAALNYLNNLTKQTTANKATTNTNTPPLIKRVQTKAINKSWDKKTTHLNALGQLVVQVVVATATSGSGNALLAGTTLKSNTALAAAIDSVVNQVSQDILTAVITGEPIDIDITNLAKGALAAGALDYTNNFLDAKLALPKNASFTQEATSMLAHSSTKAAITTALYGGSYKDALINNITNSLTNRAYQIVGNVAMQEELGNHNQSFKDGGVAKTLLHATVGGVSSLAKGGDFLTGAAAAGARELLSPLSANTNQKSQDATSQLIGGSIGALTQGSKGVNIGSQIALSAEKNNRQLHQKEIEWIKSHAKEFANLHPGMSIQEAQKILYAAAKGMVDSATNHQLNKQSDKAKLLTAKNIEDAQKYIQENSQGESYIVNSDDKPILYTHSMFKATKGEYLDYSYDPNEILGSLISTDELFMPLPKSGLFRYIESSSGKTIRYLEREGKDSAKNVANYEKLKQDLKARERNSYFNEDGTLTKEALSNGKVVIEGKKLKSDDVIESLTSDGSKIEDWNKMSIKIGKEEVHYYQNAKTGKVSYDKDYKVKLSNSYYKESKSNTLNTNMQIPNEAIEKGKEGYKYVKINYPNGKINYVVFDKHGHIDPQKSFIYEPPRNSWQTSVGRPNFEESLQAKYRDLERVAKDYKLSNKGSRLHNIHKYNDLLDSISDILSHIPH